MDNSLFHDIKPIFSQLHDLADIALIQYKLLANDIISGKINDPDEITRIMEYMLDFCFDDQVLDIYKAVCRSQINKYPDLVQYLVHAYRDTWDTEYDGEIPY
jgi:hypothetical protein